MVAAHVVTDDSLKIKSFAEWLLMVKKEMVMCEKGEARMCSLIKVQVLRSASLYKELIFAHVNVFFKKVSLYHHLRHK